MKTEDLTRIYYNEILLQWNKKPCLYIVNCIGRNLYKVGITNDIKRRFKQLDSSTGSVLTIYKLYFFDDINTACREEAEFMRNNKHLFRVNEWFRCNASELWNLENNIKFYEFSHYIDRDLYDKLKLERMGGAASVTHI